MKKRIPKFNNEDQERDFWASSDSVEYVDWESAKRVEFSSLRESAGNSHQATGIDGSGSGNAGESER